MPLEAKAPWRENQIAGVREGHGNGQKGRNNLVEKDHGGKKAKKDFTIIYTLPSIHLH
jgi:hypothetical protein